MDGVLGLGNGMHPVTETAGATLACLPSRRVPTPLQGVAA